MPAVAYALHVLLSLTGNAPSELLKAFMLGIFGSIVFVASNEEFLYPFSIANTIENS